MEERVAISEGLEGIVAAETELSHVDGHAGVLILRGHSIERIAPRASVEDACHLLWHGKLPSDAERERMRERLYRGRALAYAALPRLGDALDARDAMDALRSAISHMAPSSRGAERAAQSDPRESGSRRALLDGREGRVTLSVDKPDDPALLTGAMAVFAAAHHRRRAGLSPLAPDASASHAADYLAMTHGQAPNAAQTRAMDTYLVTISDHGMNASTFAARVVTSTGSDMVSAVVAGIGALKGPLHGGAPGPVLDMLDAIGTADRAPAWLAAELAARRRIMGMGHRVYRVRDPRAAVLEQALRDLSGHAHALGRLTLARAVEAGATALLDARHPERKLRANVEFFTAVLLEALGIDRRSLTATFAVGRVVGWCGHVIEQQTKGRLIRPAAKYVGPIAD